jgi:uncharacterized membrane protein
MRTIDDVVNRLRPDGAKTRVTRATGIAVAGALFGVLVVLVLAEYPSKWLLTVAALLGAVVVSALWRASGLQ